MTKKFEMSMMGELTYFLGLQIKQDDKGISICQEQYTRNLLKKYEIFDSFSVKTLMVPPNNLGPNLAGKQSCPKESHLIVVKRIFKYLKGTLSVGLYYPKCSGVDLKGYSDSEYASCNMDIKSTLGTCQILKGKLVCWSAKRQQSVAISSVEAEYVATAGCCANILSANHPAYHEIYKYLINCPLAEAFTKTSSVVYQNLLREFWCIVITHDLNPPINDSEARPLKEYLIKFLVMNGKKPLILNYKTFVESIGLDYSKGTYVSHPFPDAVKAKLAKIVENPILLDRTPGLEASGSLPQKRKKPKSKKTPTKTQVTPPTGPTKGSEQSHSVSSGNVHDPQDPKRNKQLAGTTTDPKDSKGNVQTADKGLSSTVSDEGTVKTTPLLEGTHGDKYLEGFKPPADMEPLTTHVVDPSGTDAKYQADQ
ncbi:retrovirus-related pol polyprotein from transposon TNT 1-94, partial [Tanacetum coccineum]